MKQFIKVWTRLIEDESGQDLIEYALVTALIGLAAVATLQSLALEIIAIFAKITTTLTTAAAAA